MARVCNRHPFILSENLCGRCGQEFCRECLVFPRGQKLPLCVDCAVTKSGVRAGKDVGLSKREIRTLAKARRTEMAEQSAPKLPEIANPVPAGWARDDDPPLDEPKVGLSRRRYRDAGRRAATERSATERTTPAPEPVFAPEPAAAEPAAGRPAPRAAATADHPPTASGPADAGRAEQPPAPRRGRAARRGTPDTTREETADMMSFLDSMYSKD